MSQATYETSSSFPDQFPWTFWMLLLTTKYARKKCQTDYGTTSIWYRGGSRYVEECWGFRYLKIKKISCFLGFLCFMDIRISKIYQDTTIVKLCFFVSTLWECNCFGPNKSSTVLNIYKRCSKIFPRYSDLLSFSCFQILFWLKRSEIPIVLDPPELENRSKRNYFPQISCLVVSNVLNILFF